MTMEWKDLDYETRLNVASHIFKAITKDPCCSFRKLIYDRLGFDTDAYAELYTSGGMVITNAMYTEKTQEKVEWYVPRD